MPATVETCLPAAGRDELPATVRLFGLSLSGMSYQRTVQRVAEQAFRAEGQRLCIFSANVDQVVRYHSDPAFQEAYAGADLILPDGMPLVWCARGLRLPLRERVTGIDLLGGLCGAAALDAAPCYFLGARPETLRSAVRNLKARFPGLAVCGSHPGYFDDDAAVVRQINATDPVLLFVGMGSPRQELWLKRNFSRLHCKVALAVGGALDVLAGDRKRAPVPVQNMGLEWLWRLGQEPRRLWRRYLVKDARFLAIVWRELRNHAGTAAPS
jgi:N-acetylglucosaminyldiphosphoundecaprenol N-acetyl-beta-D-mannosaminyltransferase